MNRDGQPAFSTVSTLIAQGYRESWQRYCESLEAPGEDRPHWDWIVLTAGDERQAKTFEMQLDWRRQAGLLPQAARFLVVADPRGRRVGSGGATINALAEVGRQMAEMSQTHRPPDIETLFRRKRILLLHSGGESRRLPHCSALGKIFARVPRELPDGRASTLFDEFLISLSGLPYRMYEGVFVTSGDVLLLFDHRQLELSRQGVVGAAAAAPAEVGAHHGVYLVENGGDRVRRFLHKVSLDALRSNGAVDSSGNVPIDTGMVWFDPSAAARLLGLFGFDPQLEVASGGPFSEIVTHGGCVNLYSDLLMPLAIETEREHYLEDASDGVAAPVVRNLRPAIWESFRGVPFRAQSLFPVEFIHFGTTAEYVAVLTEGLENRAALGWTTPVASFQPDRAEAAKRVVVLSSSLAKAISSATSRNVIEDCCLGGETTLGDRCLLSHVWSERPIVLPNGVVMEQLSVAAFEGSPSPGFVTRLYGVDDNPKMPFDHPSATYLNRPWDDWLREAGVTTDDLWEKGGAGEKSLWTARLFPLATSREASLAFAEWLLQASAHDSERRRRWLSAKRLSLAESTAHAAASQMLKDLWQTDDLVRVQRFCTAVEQEQPSASAGVHLGVRPADIRRRAAAAADQFAADARLMVAIHGFKALADAFLAQKGDPASLEDGRRCEDQAFDVLAHAIRAATPHLDEIREEAPCPRERPRRTIVRAPARIDFAGGWSDTPPFSIEYGGTVLNAAIQLRGQLPIQVECEVLDRPVLVLETRDLDVSRTFDSLDSILDYADPSDPLALHKAAVVLAGLARPRVGRRQDDDLARSLGAALDGGLRVSTEVALPHGSGLGTSSILAGALIAAVRVLLGRPIEFDSIYDEVLCLEQMLTTGGGWQDQVGGMLGGIKLATTRPGLPQRPMIEPVRLSPEVAEHFRRRLMLIYTGQRRLAKGILRAIMGAFMSRQPEVVQILFQIRDVAVAERRALERGDLDELGRWMAEHWALNKRMDPGTSNPFIDRLFEICAPFSSGAKLAGAGGGGFMMLIARDEAAPARLTQALAEAFPATDIAPWPCEIAEQGLVIDEG
jgi:fucokinase